jgi:diguanylate cyclase (GGDEF)-like protein
MQEIEKLHEKLREQAFLDPLTGLNNRRYLSERMTGEIARADRENACLSILIADIDHFKNINDTYGHQVGDKFLVEIAGLLKNHTRGSDIVCRYGGEEFMMVLPGTIAEVAVQRAESFREMCTSIRIPYEDQELKVTLSFGVAAYPVHGKDAEEVILKADKAMYRSKSDGRNRVTLWKE